MELRKLDVLRIINKNNLLDINYYFSSDKLSVITRLPIPSWYRNNIYYSIILFFMILFKKLFSHQHNRVLKEATPILLLANTQNQRDALMSLVSIRNDCKIIGEDKFGDYIFPNYMSYFYSIPYLFDVFRFYKESLNYTRLSFQYVFHEYLLVYGRFRMFVNFFSSVNAQIVVVSNDHVANTRIIAFVCKYIGAKSIYIQHASITQQFPSLIFDYALLEGRDALDKYLQIGNIDSEVFLIGTLKESEPENICVKNKIDKIGVCFNLVDDLSLVEDLIVEALKLFNSKNIILRPHPKDDRDYFTNRMKSKYDIGISNSREQISIEFLKQVECIIASESNIHLEATLQNIVPIYYKFTNNDSFDDWYGFIKNKLLLYSCNSLRNLSEVLHSLKKEKPNVRHLAKYYNSTIATEFEGKSNILYDEVISYIKTGNCDFIEKTFNLENINGVKVYSLR